MKKLLFATLAICLMAGVASAAIPDNALRSLDKFPPVKERSVDAKIGALDCSGAIEVALDNTYFGDNTGLPNNVTTYDCSLWDESGGEVVYHIFLPTPTMFTASVTPTGCDLDMAVLDQCDEIAGCLIVVDSGVETLVPVSGDIYFVIDGYSGAGCPFEFTIESVALPEPVDFCADVQDASGSTFSGSTCDGVNNISSLPCGAFTEDGLEHYFEINMPPLSSFTATVTNTEDGALWVMDNCAEPMNCLAYADDTLTGDPETVSYTNTSGVDEVVYLVVDSYSFAGGGCGTYDLSFSSTGGAVEIEQKTFGAVKSQFR